MPDKLDLKSLKDLRGLIKKLEADDVDDPEEILAELGIESERFGKALDAAIKGLS